MIPYHADRIAQRVLICCTIQRTIVPVSAREHADARRRSLGATTFPLKGVLCYACRAPAFGRNLADIAGVTDGWIGCGSPRASVRTQPDGDRCVCSSSQRVPTHQAIGACQRSPAFDSDRRASPAHRGYGADGHGCRCGVLACDAAPLRAPRKGSVPGSDVWFAAIPCALPLIPPASFSHKGRRGRLGVLMPETGEERHCRGADGD